MFVKGYGFSSFNKYIGTNATTAEGTGNLIGNKIADKITNFFKNSSRKIHS